MRWKLSTARQQSAQWTIRLSVTCLLIQVIRTNKFLMNSIQTIRYKSDLTEIMATSTNYNELEYVWTQWREVAGKPIRQQYLEFVELNNKAAVLNGTTLNPGFIIDLA